jgi:hypothetical protein
MLSVSSEIDTPVCHYCYAAARMRAAAELKTGKAKHKGKTEKIQRNIKNKKIMKKCRKKEKT